MQNSQSDHRTLTGPSEPAQPQFVVVQPPPEPWLKSSVKRIVWGVFLTCVVSVIANQGGFKWGAVMVSKAVLIIFDRHPKPPGPIKEVVDEIEGKVEKTAQKISELKPPVLGHTSLPLAAIPAAAGIIHDVMPTPEQREAERLRDRESQLMTFRARADVVGMKYEPDWTLEKFRIEVPIAERKVVDAKERKNLLAVAAEMEMKVDEEWDNHILEAELKIEKKFRLDDADYQEKLTAWEKAMQKHEYLLKYGPNARCTNPQCRHAMRVGNSNTQGQCKRCLTFFPRSQARALWREPRAPERPKPPVRGKSGFLKRLFG